LLFEVVIEEWQVGFSCLSAKKDLLAPYSRTPNPRGRERGRFGCRNQFE
jgi:hypothetical protein